MSYDSYIFFSYPKKYFLRFFCGIFQRFFCIILLYNSLIISLKLFSIQSKNVVIYKKKVCNLYAQKLNS
jgi:hypothetical protein